VDLDKNTVTKLREGVAVYDSEELPKLKYKRLGTIQGYSCMYWEWGPRSSREEAIDQLRYRASALGGNGIANLACTEEGLSLAKNCYNSVTCNAVAIYLEPAGHTPSIPSGQVPRADLSAELVKKREANDIDTVRPLDVEQLQAGVVKIAAKSDEGTRKVGTGFIIRLDKDAAYIVTAAHVIAGDPRPKVEFFTKRNVPFVTEVLGVEGDDEVRGLGLLVVRGQENLPKGLRALPLAETLRFSGGEDIIMIGFPGNAGPWNVVKSNVSSRQGRDLYFSPVVDSGHSGGPILQNGKVVGLVAAVGQSSGRGVIARSDHDYVEGFGVTVEGSVTPGSP
jgi:S1-C subfamily serine protease